MAVRIRLKRMGAKKRPFYRIIVADSRSPRDGRFIETLGYYDPLTNPATVKVDAEKYQKWVGNGAQPSDSVVGVLKRSGALEAQPESAPQAAQATPAPVAATPAPAAPAPEEAPEETQAGATEETQETAAAPAE